MPPSSACSSFSDIQGQDNWFYNRYEGGMYVPLEYDFVGGTYRWRDMSAGYPQVWINGGLPDHDVDGVRTWEVPQSGSISIRNGGV